MTLNNNRLAALTAGLTLTCLLQAQDPVTTAAKNIRIPDTYKPAGKDIYHKGWIDFNKNGRKDVFEDPTANLDARIEDLLSQMTVEEKTCQMVTLYGYKRVLKDDLPTPGGFRR